MSIKMILRRAEAWRGSAHMVAMAMLTGALLSGCATTVQPLGDAEFPAAMELSNVKVEELVAADKGGDAVALLAKVAKDNPARKEPWLRLARLHFDGEDYGNAIVASEEVIKRDGADRTAKSIRAVSGLRVAAQSVAELRKDAELKGSARDDAVTLAKELRETLGESVLFPQPVPEVKASVEPDPEAAPTERKPVKTRPRAKPARATATPSVQPVNGDPFSVLR